MCVLQCQQHPHVTSLMLLLACRIALYVPSATELTRGGFFYQRAGTDTYDTIISAQHILKSMGDSHAAELSKLQLQLDASKQLLQSPAAAASRASSSSSAVAPADADADAVADTKEGRKGRKASAAAAGDVGGTLMQLVAAGLSTDEDVSRMLHSVAFIVACFICSAMVPQTVAPADGLWSAPDHSLKKLTWMESYLCCIRNIWVACLVLQTETCGSGDESVVCAAVLCAVSCRVKMPCVVLRCAGSDALHSAACCTLLYCTCRVSWLLGVAWL
jgi:hypothetical protein